MASKAKTVVQKLHAVTQVKSCIGRPWWEKRTIKALGFSRLHQTIIHKNIPTVNGALRSVKHLLEIKPVEIVEEDPTEGQKNGQEGLFLRQNGHFHLNKFKNFLENNPDMKEMIYKRKKQAIWERRRSWLYYDIWNRRSTQEQCTIFRGIRNTVRFKLPLIAYLNCVDVNDQERPATITCVLHNYVMDSPHKEQTIAYTQHVCIYLTNLFDKDMEE